jgi:AcrR family transcriptional regulator
MLTRDAILTAAVDLASASPGRLSLRGIATALGVTPMALYPHVGGLDGLIDALAERCFAVTPAGAAFGEDPDLRTLLLWYCDRVLRYPALSSAIVARHGALPRPHQAWTEALTQCLLDGGWPILWRDALVDHLHGFALSTAAGGGAESGGEATAALATYARHLDLLLPRQTGLVSPSRH